MENRLPQRRVLFAMFLTLVGGVYAAPAAHAVVWTVERDGSGHYTLIQDAVDAAAEGDTIQIGPGRYIEYQDYLLNCCFSQPVYVGIPTPNLTLIGSHRDSVVIGPDVMTGDEAGIALRLDSSAGLVVQDLTIQQASYGIRFTHDATFVNVAIRDCWIGASIESDTGATMMGCLFEQNNCGITAYPSSSGVAVLESEFRLNRSSINFTGSQNALVDKCSFTESGITGIIAAGGAEVVIQNCTIVGGSNSGIAIANSTTATILDNHVTSGGFVAVTCTESTRFEAKRNVFSGGSLGVLRFANQRNPIDVAENYFQKGTGYSARMDGYSESLGEATLSVAGNYWGSSDPDSVSAWILDGNDDPDIHGFLEFEPILDTNPVSVRASTMGSLKAVFDPVQDKNR